MSQSDSSSRATSKLAERRKIEKRAGDRVVIPLVQAHLLERSEPFRDPNVIHASEMSAKDWCDRATWCRLSNWEPPAERFNFYLESIWDEGNELHTKWQHWLEETGELWGDWLCLRCGDEVKLSLHPDDRDYPTECWHLWQYKEVGLLVGKISGHEDAAIVSKRRLVEFKSMALGSMRIDSPELLAKYYGQWSKDGRTKKVYDLDDLWKGLKVPLKSWVRQANIYLWLAQELKLPFDKVSIVAEYKVNQQAKEWIIPYSARICEPLIDRAQVIIEAYKTGQPVDCPYGGCKQCKAWENANPSDKGTQAVPARRVVHKGERKAGGAGTGTTRAANWRNAEGTSRSHRVRRQRTDEAVPEGDRVAELPSHTASVRGGRRTGRR